MNRQRWEDWVTALIGLWVFVTPFVLPMFGASSLDGLATGNFYILGILIAVVGLAEAYAYRLWEEWVGIVLGLWLLISPWVLGFSGMSVYMLDALIAGAIVAVLAGWEAFTEPERA